jgi:hypothetical protein
MLFEVMGNVGTPLGWNVAPVVGKRAPNGLLSSSNAACRAGLEAGIYGAPANGKILSTRPLPRSTL